MSAHWYIIANAAEARVYERNTVSDQLELLETLTHPESRMKGSELSSDRPGHNQSAGGGHGSFVEKSDPKSYEIERFAIEIADYLNQQRNHNKYSELCIVAAPRLHGLMNKHMNKNVSKLVSKNIEKDLTHISDDKLEDALAMY